MNHLTLRGTHREMGFQWGARLAERGLRLLDHVPFPLEAERRAFAAACHPAYARHFPAALEELEGLAAGQNCRQEDLETVLFTTYALPPACGCSCLAVSNGNGVFFGRNSDFLTAEERRRGLAAIMRQATCCGDWTFPDAAVDAVCVLRLDAEELSCKEHL